MRIFKRKDIDHFNLLWLYRCYLDDGTIKGIVDDSLRVVEVDIKVATNPWLIAFHDRVAAVQPTINTFYNELSPTDPEYNMVKMLIL